MIDELIRELHETWGYETEELNDIREKMEELANSCFWEGYNEKSADDQQPMVYGGFAYAKRSDMDGYE